MHIDDVKHASCVLVGLIVLTATGCGGGERDKHDGHAVRKTKPVPRHAIATVDDSVIPRKEFERSWTVLTRGQARLETDKRARRAYRRLIAAQLIENEWLEQEAAKQHVDVTNAEAIAWYESKAHSKQRADEAGSDSSAYGAALILGHGARNARRNQARAEILRQKLVARAVGKNSVPSAQVRAYYEQHKAEFVPAEVRQYHLAVSKHRATVERAKRTLERGGSWRAVDRKYSLDDVFTRHTRGLEGSIKAELEPPLGDAVFGARRGVLSGPVKTSTGWYVFEVATIVRSPTPSLAQLGPSIEIQFQGRRLDAEKRGLNARLRREYRSRTVCAKAFVVPDCSNGPKGGSLFAGA